MSITSRTAGAAVLSLAVILGAGPTAHAANPAKKAVKALKKGTSSAMKDLSTNVKGFEKLLDANLDVLDLKLKQGSGTQFDVQTVFDALETYQASLANEMNDAGGALRLALLAAQPILTDAGIDSDDLPSGFYFGDGGVCDRYRDDVLAAVDKSLAAAEKRVMKTAALFEKHADVGVLVRLAPPRNLIEWPGMGSSTFTPLQHTISILLSSRPLATPDEGKIYASGNCYSNDTLTLASYSNPGPGFSTSITTYGNKWSRTVSSLGSGYHVIKLSVSGVTGGGAYGAIGVR